jgi:hypothetical protein
VFAEALLIRHSVRARAALPGVCWQVCRALTLPPQCVFDDRCGDLVTCVRGSMRLRVVSALTAQVSRWPGAR